MNRPPPLQSKAIENKAKRNAVIDTFNIPKIAKLIQQMKLTVPGDDTKMNMMNGIMNLGLFIEGKVEETLIEIAEKKRNFGDNEEEKEKTISGVMSTFKLKHKI